MSDECLKMSPLGSPEGYKIVAGGRSEAQTTGSQAGMTAPRRGARWVGTQKILFETLAPFQGATLF